MPLSQPPAPRPQERILVVTDQALYNLNKQRKMKRRIGLGAIAGPA